MFKVIDPNTEKYPDLEKVALTEEWAEGLCYCDMEGFAIGEDGNLILMDECGRFACPPADRFIVENCLEWISVKDALPERGGFYITYQGKHYYSKIQVLRWDSLKGDWRGAQVGAVMEGVTHWARLPEPPEEG